ncbi:MAG: DUF4249 domain-containing protein [Flavobacteriales bacterium]
MRFHSTLFCVATLLLLTISSCEKVIEFDIPEAEPALVLNGYIALGEVVRVNASSSLSYLEGGEPEFLNDLTFIGLYKDDVFMENLQLEDADFGKYVSSNLVTSAGFYEIRASAEGYESVEAVTYIPEPLNNSEVELVNTLDNGDREYELSFTDPIAEDDYYHMIVATPDSEFQPAFAVEFSSNSEVFFIGGFNIDTEGENFILNEGIFSDDLINDSNVNIRFKIRGTGGGPLQLQLLKCSQDYYLYHRSLFAYQNAGGPFSEPVQIYTNVENGLGVVAGYTLQLLDIED